MRRERERDERDDYDEEFDVEWPPARDDEDADTKGEHELDGRRIFPQ